MDSVRDSFSLQIKLLYPTHVSLHGVQELIWKFVTVHHDLKKGSHDAISLGEDTNYFSNECSKKFILLSDT